MEHFTRRPALAWVSVSLLALLCGLLGFLQYRWVGAISVAERSRLTQQLQNRLLLLSRNFNEEISTACAALIPATGSIQADGRERAYSERYRAWRESNEPLFRRIAVAVPDGQGVELYGIDLATGELNAIPWPAGWKALEERFKARERGAPMGPFGPLAAVLEFPRLPLRFDPGRPRSREFGGPPLPEPGAPPFREQEWLVAELNLDFLSGILLPEYFNRFLGDAGHLDYDAQVVSAADVSDVIYSSSPGITLAGHADATIPLLDVRFNPGERGHGRGGRMARFGGRGGPPSAPSEGRWVAFVRHRAGSLDALVSQTRRRNLAVSGGVLLLILATVALLVRFSRQAQQLANLQMNFVAGVSHELRTPLTVIRTAAFNLRGRMAHNPAQVERYGALIQSESERLESLVEQVLQFAAVNAGHVIRAREPVAVENLIEQSLASSCAAVAGRGVNVERHIDPGLPLVLADETALRHAIQNLIDNAVKYGLEGSNWIGLFASAVSGEAGSAVEIRVADRGPGIPADEQDQVFDPFFRGRRAVQDQVHGTGLGLNLVKRIIEAHGGNIQVKSQPTEGTEFVVRIPAAPPEMQDEFAHTSD